MDNDKFTFDIITSCLNRSPDCILTGFKLKVYKKTCFVPTLFDGQWPSDYCYKLTTSVTISCVLSYLIYEYLNS